MPDCFWTGFIGSYDSACGAAPPPPDGCDGVPALPPSVDIAGSTGGGAACPVLWAAPVFEGYIVSPAWEACSAFDANPTSVTYIRECDAAIFIVPVGSADIVCC